MRGGSAIWLLALSSHVYSQNLNSDTGIGADQCYRSGSNAPVACSDTDLPLQDGHVGRDVQVPDATDGRLGFSYSKVCHSGEVAGTGTCPTDPSLGDGPDDWACTRDNVSGAVFEVKTASGPRAGSLRYTNYNSKYNPRGKVHAASNAQGYIDLLNSMQLCGASDWVFDHATRVQSIVNYGSSALQPMLDPLFFPNIAIGTYWTSSNHPNPRSQGWSISLRHGTIAHDDERSVRHYMLANRPAKTPIGSRWELADENREVIDRIAYARAIWRRCVAGMEWDGATCTGEPQRMTHEDALRHAADVAAQTGRNWRLPNVKELTWLIERSSWSPAIDVKPFPATPPEAVWASTPFIPNPGNAWTVDFDFGVAAPLPRSSAAVVRLVRSVE